MTVSQTIARKADATAIGGIINAVIDVTVTCASTGVCKGALIARCITAYSLGAGVVLALAAVVLA